MPPAAKPKEAAPSNGSASTPKYEVPPFSIQTTTPPGVTRTGRTSPYAPAEMVPQMWEALKNARRAKDDPKNLAADSAWVSFLSSGLTSESRARNAAGQIRKAVASYGSIQEKALAGRVWEADGAWYFAVQIRPGVTFS